MSDLPAPKASRLQPPRWRDTRFIGGVLAVLLSVVLGAKVVAEADDTVPVWALRVDVPPMTALTADDLQPADVLLGASAARYVLASGDPPVGYVVTRPLGAGELLPRAALSRTEESGFRRVSVGVGSAEAAGLARGSVVDVYVVPEVRGAAQQPPAQKVLDRVTVADKPQGRSGLTAGGTSQQSVVLLVPAEDVATFLTARARGEVSLAAVIVAGAGPAR